MQYAFNDIKHIVKPYLNDFPALSKQRDLHVDHLRVFFLRFRHFNIHLNPYKCVFCVETSRPLGFIVSKGGICIDPLKIKSILALPTPTNIKKLQILQGKENVLRRFVCNYAERTRGFMQLLKRDTPFVWDDFM